MISNKFPFLFQAKILSVLNFYLDEEKFPPYLPQGDFQGYVGIKSNKEIVLETNVKVYVADKNGETYRRKYRSGA